MDEQVPTIRLRLWLETDKGTHFGMGRALLLAKIEQHGSLKRAADELGMSYRAAWGKIKESEKILGFKLITQHGSKREGYQLTEPGRALMEKFLLWFDAVEGEALARAGSILSFPVQRYQDRPRTEAGGEPEEGA